MSFSFNSYLKLSVSFKLIHYAIYLVKRLLIWKLESKSVRVMSRSGLQKPIIVIGGNGALVRIVDV
jgi:hypothetical protein